MVNVPASSAVVRVFEIRPGQTKDYKIGICCFSGKHQSPLIHYLQFAVANLSCDTPLVTIVNLEHISQLYRAYRTL